MNSRNKNSTFWQRSSNWLYYSNLMSFFFHQMCSYSVNAYWSFEGWKILFFFCYFCSIDRLIRDIFFINYFSGILGLFFKRKPASRKSLLNNSKLPLFRSLYFF